MYEVFEENLRKGGGRGGAKGGQSQKGRVRVEGRGMGRARGDVRITVSLHTSTHDPHLHRDISVCVQYSEVLPHTLAPFTLGRAGSKPV